MMPPEPVKGSLIRRGCPDGDRSPLQSGPPLPCAFLDRDGVLNKDFGYVHRIQDFQWLPGAKESVSRLKDEGWLVVVVTNQSGIDRGFYTEEELIVLSEWMLGEAPIDLILYCPHLLDCPARKPGTGMIEAACSIFPIDLSRSFLVGDKETDLECARRAGIRGIKFKETMGSLEGILSAEGVLCPV